MDALLEGIKEYNRNNDTVTIKFRYKGKKGVIARHKLNADEFNGNTLTEACIARFSEEIAMLAAHIEKKDRSKIKMKNIVIKSYKIHHKHQFN